jgi:ribosomal-protein-alanine acetyltransferase
MSGTPAAAKLRRGRIGDLDALAALEREFFAADHRLSRRSLCHFISSPKSTLIVAEAGESVAGYALVNYRHGSKRARLYTIAVAGAFQRRGIARRLLAAAERSARAHGCGTMRLEAREDDAGAIALYESSGYNRFGRRRRYYDGRVDALLFEKPLAAKPRRRSAGQRNWTDSGRRIGFDGGHRLRRRRQSLLFRL